jgi:hypothetical protein
VIAADHSIERDHISHGDGVGERDEVAVDELDSIAVAAPLGLVAGD